MATGKQQWAAHTISCGLQVSTTVLPDNDIDLPVRVMNVQQQPVTLQSGAVIAKLEPVEVCECDQPEPADVDTDADDPILAEMVNRVHESVTAEDRQKLMELLKEFSSTFSHGETDLGYTDIITHSIDTGNSKPVRQPLRRHPPAHQEAIKQHVVGMLQQ